MLQTSQLRCERNRRLLFDNLSFSVSPGEILRIEGSNGTGKTTLLRMLCGLYQEYTGDVDWDLPDYPIYIGHRHGVKDLLSASENLRWLARLYGSDANDDEIHEALGKVGLADFVHSNCGALSEGQRKRVNLARLYLLNSPAWILDEPFSSIDVDGVDSFQNLMDEHLDGGGVILMVTHQHLRLHSEIRSIRLGVS
jgi:heme exporter protein A